MEYKYFLPSENNDPVEYSTKTNSIIIVGANGAGKSKLGAWIENNDISNVHRISGQRRLNFPENINLKSYSYAENLVLYGNSDASSNKYNRWLDQPTTILIEDFENILAAFISLNNNEYQNFFNNCRKSEGEGKTSPRTTYTVLDKLITVWDSVFPQRQLILEDAKFYSTIDKNDPLKRYLATEMSDGERSVLYLAAQVLCLPRDKTLIIDEPELHLHGTIMNRLWAELENIRPDCLFIYITHDLNFASLHKQSDKIWVKNFDGEKWNIERINTTGIPEDLLLQILGSRKSIIFVEGEKNSYDTQLYSLLYNNYHIIPCGSCSQVISRTKAFNKCEHLHHLKVYGIIDRDFRTEYEIGKYKNDNIFTINVAEVENLFIIEKVIKYIITYLAKDENDIFNNVKKYVIQDRFLNQINSQICQSVVAEIKYKLSCANISKDNEKDAKQSLYIVMNELDYDNIKLAKEKLFNENVNRDNYAEVLKYFNEKSLSKSIGQYLGIANNQYCDLILNLIKTGKHKDLIEHICEYLPSEIPIDNEL